MKKFLCILTFVLSFSSVSFAEEPPSIYINGEQLYTRNAPVMENDRVMVPLRAIFEALDRNVSWNMDDDSITSGSLWLQIGNPVAKFGEKQITMDTPAEIIGDRAYVPVRFIAESLGKKVTWDSNNNRIDINDDAYRMKIKATQDLIESNIDACMTIADGILPVKKQAAEPDPAYQHQSYLDTIYLINKTSINSINVREKEISDNMDSLLKSRPEDLEPYNTLNEYYKTYLELKNLILSTNTSYYSFDTSYKNIKSRLTIIKQKMDSI